MVTVLSKLLVALVAVPLVVYVLSLVTNLIASGIFKLSYSFRDEPLGAHWTWLHWLQLNGILFIDIFVLALWFAPVAAYQLLVSVWARKAAFIWTVMPFAALVVGERMFFKSSSVWDFLFTRLGGVMFGRVEGNAEGMDAALRGVNTLPLLTRLDLWIGVAVAVGLLYITIQIRRHRDDT